MHRRPFYLVPLVAPALAVLLLSMPTPGLLARERPEPTRQSIDHLIAQLGDESYEVREKAQQQLAKIGFDAYEALQAATENEDLEIATRAKYLLQLIRVQWTQESDPPEVKELLEDYEFQPPEERLERIRELGRLSGAKGVGPLCRLVRFEGSELLSRYAAIEVLDRRPADAAGQERWAKALEENLPRDHPAGPTGHAAHDARRRPARRPAALWLLCYLRLQREPQAALAEWAKLVEAEQASASRTPVSTTTGIVASLLYYLAEAQTGQGQQSEAEKTAAKAQALNPGNHPTSLYAHWEIAESLRRRGQFAWAEAEYRHVIDAGVPQFSILAYSRLAEMLHDKGDDLAAAETLDQMLQMGLQQLQVALGRMEQSPAQIRARMDYFYACYWQQQGDRQKQKEFLDKAIASDPGEIDTLIACYKLPDIEPEYRKKIVGLIRKAAAAMRSQIEASPDEASDYNQLAWLVGNTEGDVDEALRFAHKAVQLSPDNGAYYDTLAHVYFGKGDYQNAVKYQTRAGELEPHSGLIVKQLKVFRAKLDESKSQAKP